MTAQPRRTDPPDASLCGARTTFWPDDEACEAACMLPAGHPGTVHKDEILDEWSEGDLITVHTKSTSTEAP